MMAPKDQSRSNADASDADLQEQQRSAQEEGFDPEQTAAQDLSDLDSAEANPADVQEQSIEVPTDDEYSN